MQSGYFDCDDSDTFSESSFSGEIDVEVAFSKQYTAEAAGCGVEDVSFTTNADNRLPESPQLSDGGISSGCSTRRHHQRLMPLDDVDPEQQHQHLNKSKADNLSNCESLSDLSTDDSERCKALT